ncbi:MAG: hypothetical protein IPO09_05555 [Anaeromyxobacter sp.]|nr:hypothetical protein [Anaeromyxobacter sp.]MBL0277384.1 hypothetical protein [Anaeromyxobacter sp.]
MPTAPPATAASRPWPALAAVALLAALAAFVAGRWTAEGDGHAPAGLPSLAAPAQGGPAAPGVDRPRPAVESHQVAAAAAPAPAAAPARATPELVARATAETAAFLEASRQELHARCWPSGGLASGQPSTLVTFNVTFDARGREIARGLGEDRRARAPELLRCLQQKVPLGSLHISPPGANVGVRVAMRLP